MGATGALILPSSKLVKNLFLLRGREITMLVGAERVAHLQRLALKPVEMLRQMCDCAHRYDDLFV